MPVPEAAVHEDDSVVLRKHHVRPARQVADSKTVAETETVQELTDDEFGLRIPPSDGGHHPRSNFWRDTVSHVENRRCTYGTCNRTGCESEVMILGPPGTSTTASCAPSVPQLQRRILINRPILIDHHVAAVGAVEQHRGRALKSGRRTNFRCQWKVSSGADGGLMLKGMSSTNRNICQIAGLDTLKVSKMRKRWIEQSQAPYPCTTSPAFPIPRR